MKSLTSTIVHLDKSNCTLYMQPSGHVISDPLIKHRETYVYLHCTDDKEPRIVAHGDEAVFNEFVSLP